MRRWTVLLCISLAVMLLTINAPIASAPFGEMRLHATFECIGVLAPLEGDDASLAYREAGGEWRKAQAPLLVEGGLLVGSVFGLSPDTEYEVRITAGAEELLGTVRTRSEAVPTDTGRTIHVAADAPDGGNGGEATPRNSIQAAVASAEPGDVVLLHPGVYRESVAIDRSGTDEGYLTIRGEPGAILEGADPTLASGDAKWEPSPDFEGVYVTDASFETSYAALDGDRLYHYTSMEALASDTEPSIRGGWWQDLAADTFYVKLAEGADPTGAALDVGRERVGISIEPGAHHVLIEGLLVRNFGGEQWGAGIDVRDAAFCVIRDNTIVHCPEGIRVRGEAGHDTLVEGNECTQRNVHLWPWNRVKGTDHENSGISTTEGYGTIVHNNRVHAYFNAICASTWGDLDNPNINTNVDTCHNEMWDIGDDCLEPEGTCTNMRYFENTMRDCLVGISLAPITRGPCWVVRNTVCDSRGTWLKVSVETDGPCLLYHNTAVTLQPDANAMNVSGPWANMTFRNNVIVGTRYVLEDMQALTGITFDHDLLYTSRADGGPIIKFKDVRYQAHADVRDGLGFELHGEFGDPLFAAVEDSDLRLTPASPAIDLGLVLANINDDYLGEAPDAGAIEFEGERQTASGSADAQVGVVSHVKVLSDKVEDVSSMDAWRRSFITDDMTDEEKALAAWATVVKFRHQDAPPNEYMQSEGNVHDAIKTFNVYGYGMCCCAASNVEQLARYAGLEARGHGITAHSVPEVYYADAWHLFDASLIGYFPRADGGIASLDELVTGVRTWLDEHPDLRGDNGKLMEFARGGGWRNGPDVLSRNSLYDENGWSPAATHGWFSTMQEFDTEAFVYEYGYSQGYQVNIQLRPGERLTRNWWSKGLHVNMMEGDAPGSLHGAVGQGDLRYAPGYGDIAPGRIGNGTAEYDVPLADESLELSALTYGNLAPGRGGAPRLHADDAALPGTLVLRMPSSYVYLSGRLDLSAIVGDGGDVAVFLSDNNGLDWRQALTMEQSGHKTLSLTPWVFRRYDYLLKFVLTGVGTGLEALRIEHDIQHSQRPLPPLTEGENTISFSAEPQESTVTIDTQTNPDAHQGKQVYYMDYAPALNGLQEQYMRVGDTGTGDATFRLETPGDMVRLRFGGHYRARDERDGWDLAVSFDGGATFEDVGRFEGPTQGRSEYLVVDDIPPGAREALIRWSGQQYNTTCVFNIRMDADYLEPHGGFRPVQITYVWTEDGVEKRDVHLATSPNETYKITCAARPTMRSIILELAE